MNVSKFSLLFLLLVSSACAPRLIAAQRQEKPIATYPAAPSAYAPCSTNLELEVPQVARAEESLYAIAQRYSGSLIQSVTWYDDGKQHSTVKMQVPAYAFQDIYHEIKTLGEVVRTWGDSPACDTPNGYAQITVYLNPAEPAAAPRPLRTLQSAWRVSLSLLGYLLDALIWLTVVGGPIALLLWAAYALFRKVISPKNTP